MAPSKPLTDYPGWRISFLVLGLNLFEGANPADLAGLDQEASIKEYVKQCEAALEREFPGAKVDVECQRNTGGAGGGVTVTLPRGAWSADNAYLAERDTKEQAEAVLERVFADGRWYVELHYGAKEFAAALGYSSSKFGVYRLRGLFPAPEFTVASGPVWTHSQVQACLAERAAASTGGRPIDSAYDRAFIAATERLIEDLRKEHKVEAPVTGAVIVDGIEIPEDGWDDLCSSYGMPVAQGGCGGDIDAAWDLIREKFGASSS